MAEPQQPSQPAPDATGVMTIYGQTVTRAGSLFAVGMMSIIPFGIISLAVTTRYLGPADFGRLSVLIAISSVLTILAGLAFLHGAIFASYRMVEDDDGGGVDGLEPDEIDVVEIGRAEETSAERRRILGSGLLVVIVEGSLVCGAVALLAGPLTTSVLDDFSTSSVRWMAAAAWSGSVWRLVHQIPRMERRAASWAVLQWIRPALVVGASVAALVSGLGIDGVLMATAGGTFVSVVIAFVAYRKAYRFGPQRGDLAILWDQGKRWIPLNISSAVQSNANILVLGALATPTSVGLFQVASRIAQLPMFFAEGFLTGWPSFELSPISKAAKDRKGVAAYRGTVFTLFCLSTMGLLVAVILLSDALVHIAAPSYSAAANLIPIVAVGLGAHALFRGLYRATGFRNKRYWFMLLTFLWIAPYAAVAALVIPLNASYGVAIAQIVAGGLVSLGMILKDRGSRIPVAFQWRRLGAALLVATACVVAVQLVPDDTPLHAALSLAALFAFPLILIATGTVSRSQVAIVRKIVGSVIPRPVSKADVRQRLASLPDNERQALVLLACERQPPEAVAASLGVTTPVAYARLVRGLRRFAGDGHPTHMDHLIGSYVLQPGGTIERDAVASELLYLGVDPLQLHTLEETIRTVSKLGPGGTGGDLKPA